MRNGGGRRRAHRMIPDAILFSDTKRAEDQVQNVIGGGRAGDGIERAYGHAIDVLSGGIAPNRAFHSIE